MESAARVKIGLALGGGAMRGMAHIGVLIALERAGVPIDTVAGTSVGALIGACYAAGLSADALREFAMQIGWRHLARLTIPGDGLLTFAPLERWLVNRLGDLSFADLARPFAAVATDLAAGQPVVLQTGRVAAAVRASCSIPGLVKPIQIEGRTLYDGGVSDNLPVDAARALGADYVIAVNVVCHTTNPPGGAYRSAFTALEMLICRAGGGLQSADCLISPPLDGLTYMRFARGRKMIVLGERAAEEKLPEILTALQGLNPNSSSALNDQPAPPSCAAARSAAPPDLAAAATSRPED
jgi:NTE family protein